MRENETISRSLAVVPKEVAASIDHIKSDKGLSVLLGRGFSFIRHTMTPTGALRLTNGDPELIALNTSRNIIKDYVLEFPDPELLYTRLLIDGYAVEENADERNERLLSEAKSRLRGSMDAAVVFTLNGPSSVRKRFEATGEYSPSYYRNAEILDILESIEL